jgi:hypothetical protein
MTYKNHLTLGESFQRDKNGSWVSQHTLTREESAGNGNDFPSHQYQFNAIFRTDAKPTNMPYNEHSCGLIRTKSKVVIDMNLYEQWATGRLTTTIPPYDISFLNGLILDSNLPVNA